MSYAGFKDQSTPDSPLCGPNWLFALTDYSLAHLCR